MGLVADPIPPMFASPGEPPPEQDYKCNGCEKPFRGPSHIGRDFRCPHCDSPPPFAAMLNLHPARSESSASLTLTTDQVLDAQRLTVLGVLGTIGLTVGLTLGFGIGGWWGVGVRAVSAVLAPLGLAEAFRRRPTRLWLAKAADWAVDRPNLRRR